MKEIKKTEPSGNPANESFEKLFSTLDPEQQAVVLRIGRAFGAIRIIAENYKKGTATHVKSSLKAASKFKK